MILNGSNEYKFLYTLKNTESGTMVGDCSLDYALLEEEDVLPEVDYHSLKEKLDRFLVTRAGVVMYRNHGFVVDPVSPINGIAKIKRTKKINYGNEVFSDTDISISRRVAERRRIGAISLLVVLADILLHQEQTSKFLAYFTAIEVSKRYVEERFPRQVLSDHLEIGEKIIKAIWDND